MVASFCGQCVNSLNLPLSGGKFVELKGLSVPTHAHSTLAEIPAMTRNLKSTVFSPLTWWSNTSQDFSIVMLMVSFVKHGMRKVTQDLLSSRRGGEERWE